MKLKQLKEQPLLAPPKRWEGVWDILEGCDILTDIDARKMRDSLPRIRKEHYKWNVSLMLYYMRGLGLPATPTAEDVRMMRAQLARDRRSKTEMGSVVCETIQRMRAIGVDEKLTEADRQAINRSLEEARRTRSGGSIMNLLCIMKALQMPCEMGDDDVAAAKTWLKFSRETERDPYNLASLLSNMYRLGLNPAIKAQDVEAFKGCLQEDRKRMGKEDVHSLRVAGMLLSIREIRAEEQPKTQPMPPLKEFGTR